MCNYASQICTLIVFACFIAKCIIPCLNGGRCRGVNKCRCPSGFKGDHCEIGRRVPARSTCTKPCEHGTCKPDNTCLCDEGWYGKLCHQSKWQEADWGGKDISVADYRAMKTRNKHRGRAQLIPGEDKLSDSHWLPSQNLCKHNQY